MYNLTLILGVVSALVGLALPRVATAQQTVPLPVEDALKVHSFGQLVPARFSPDGKRFAYTVQDHQRGRLVTQEAYVQTGVPPWGVGADIFVLDVASSDSKNLTGGIGNNWHPSWSPDGRSLAFLSDRGDGDHTRLWIWDAVRNELRKVSDAKLLHAEEIEWTRDSRKILITAVPERLFSGDQVRQKSALASQQGPLTGTAPNSTVILYKSGLESSHDQNSPRSDPWDLDSLLRDLILVNVNDGSSSPLVQGRRIAHYRISPDRSHVAYTIPKRFEKAGSQQILFDLGTIAFDTREQRVLESDIRLDYDGAAFSWSPDGMQLAFRKGGMEDRTSDCYIVRADGGRSRNMSTFPTSETRSANRAGTPLWDAKGTIVYLLRDGVLWRCALEEAKAEKIAEIGGRRIVRLIQRSGNLLWSFGDAQTIVVTHDDFGKQDGFYRVDLEHGATSRLMEKGQCYTCSNVEEWQFADTSNDGRSIAFYSEDAQHSKELWISDPSFRTIRRLTHLNPQFDKVSTGSSRLIEWRGYDGQSLKGALLLPSNYEEGKRYPLVVWVYGGSFLSNQIDQFGLGYEGPFNMQLFATRGYAVLMPDAPQHIGTPMADLATTVLPGVNKVVEIGVADPDRIGVMGHSNGGYSTLALIVQTNRFKAAIEVDGMGDLVGFYGEMDKTGAAYGTANVEHNTDALGGTLWDFRERYLENSPIFYLDRVETPLLIVHGDEDTAVASFLGDQVFVGLRRLGKEVQYAKYLGEGHSPTDWCYANQLDLSNRMIGWFNQYLKQ
jgi:dipeptidyl aminopeptidase/acylaminoacyl peptidase